MTQTTSGESRTLAGFRRSYNATADATLSSGGFHQRLTLSFVEYICDLVECDIDEIAVLDAVDVDNDRFRDVMITDGTVPRLYRLLSEKFEQGQGETGGA